MTLNAEFYTLTQETQGAIFQAAMTHNPPSGDPPPAILQVKRGYAESPGWIMVQAAEFDPEPLSVERLRVRAVWSSESIIKAILEMLASEKWFDRMGDDYYLTASGRDILTLRLERTARLISGWVAPLPATVVERLDSLLCRLIEASLQSANPPGTWCLSHSRRRAPKQAAPAIFKIFHYLSDINAFRDDTHMASWKHHEIAGYVWEAFSYVCSGDAANAESLFNQLFYRGYSRQEYAGALKELVARGWITQENSHYAPTPLGQAARDEAEHLTDEYFYAPWSTLSDEEIDDLHRLLTTLKDACQQPTI